MSIRNKLILMLALPLAALALLGALGFRSQSSNALEATDAFEQDEMIQSLNRAVKAIGGERLAVAQAVNSVFAPVIETRQATDETLVEALSIAETLELPETQAAVQQAIDTMVIVRATENLRRVVPITTSLRAARDKVEVEYPTQNSFALATSVDIAVDIADRQDSIWIEYLVTRSINTDLARRLRAETGATDLLREQITEIAPGVHEASIIESLASLQEFNMRRMGIDAISKFDRDDDKLLDAPTLTILTASHNDWHDHAISLQSDLVTELNDLTDNAESSQNLFALLATLGLFVLAGLIYVIYRSVVRPLNELLDGAEKVANHRLPDVVAELRTMGSSDANVSIEPLAKETDDELGSLVDAFNDVQLTAFDLAVEQARSRRNIAEMFVNLGRRNQKLLQRMLGVISELEHDEKDADKLKQLFQLDHMTTRMRRNAESLLVVAGTTTPRQWAKPVPAADVVRSALAEVRDYHRIDILSLADAPMAGNAVADVTHLLAELLENSLQFSEPESRVSISSRWKDGNYRIVVTDQGFGMTPEELAENNSLIASPPPPDQAPTRFLGLFVVGHLASRHGIDVELTDATIGGTDARITIPGTVMTETAPVEHEFLPANELPTRDGDVDDFDGEPHLDLDAELAKLTAETDTLREAEVVSNEAAAPGEPDVFAPAQEQGVPAPAQAEVAELPVRGEVETFTGAATEAPVHAGTDTFTDFGNEAPARPETNTFASATTDVPAPSEANTFAGASTGLPVRGDTSIDFGELPELAKLDPVAPAVSPAPAADLPVRGQAPAPAEAAPIAGLPQRTPRATLQANDGVPALNAAPTEPATEAPSGPDDVTTAAANVGSMFSAFQAGVQRGERTTN